MGKFSRVLQSSANYRLLIWAKSIKGFIVGLIAGNTILAGIAVWNCLVCRNLIDSAVAKNQMSVLQNGCLLVFLTLVMITFQACLTNLSERARTQLSCRMRQDVLEALLEKRYCDLSSYHSGEIVNRLFSDIRIVCDGILGTIPPLFSMFIRLIAAIILLAKIDLQFTCCLVCVGMFILLGSGLLRRKIKELHKAVQDSEGTLLALLQEIIGNIKFVKASSVENAMMQHAATAQAKHMATQMRRQKMMVFSHSAMGLAMESCWVCTLLWCCFRLLEGSLSYGTLMAMVQLVGQVQSPISGVSVVINRIFSMNASAERLEDIFALPADTNENVSSEDVCIPTIHQIQFRHVHFSYGSEPVLKGISGNIDDNDMVAITGLSGVGKSTLFMLMLGIYMPTSGQIEFCSEESNWKVSKQMRKAFAYVPQGNSLFSGSVRENLMLFRPGATDQELWDAVQAACIKDFIENLPEKLDTPVGERGMSLSEGQAQRIAVARAILSQSQILLLDEATSALDTETESKLLQNLAGLGRTCLIVTHRPAALTICNKHLHLENGQGDISPNDERL